MLSACNGTVATCLAGRFLLWRPLVTSTLRGTEGHSVTQFTRNVQFEIKPGKSQEFTNVMERDILPIMKKQDGFQGELALVNENGNRAVGISCWDSEQHAESYRTNTYPKVLETLKPVIQGTPSVETYIVASTTFRN
jgi:quinol monooxygenase YgiN